MPINNISVNRMGKLVLSMDKFRHELNAAVVESEDMAEATKVFFDFLSQKVKGLDFVVLEILSNRNSYIREKILYGAAGEEVGDSKPNPLLSSQESQNLIFRLSYEEKVAVSDVRENNSMGLDLKYLKEDPGSFLASKMSTPKGNQFVVEMLISGKSNGSSEQIGCLQKACKIYAPVIDYYMKIRQLERDSELQKKSFSNILELLISLLEVKDPYTSGHSSNVKRISMLIADYLGFSQELKNVISNAAILHDMGKIGIPENILNKPGRLNDGELEEIKKHPLKGALLVANIPQLKKVANVVLHHHERFDGKGYPVGLSREQIPIESRIIAVADTYDAITSERPYRKKMSEQEAIDIIAGESGKQFDPGIVKAFMGICNRI